MNSYKDEFTLEELYTKCTALYTCWPSLFIQCTELYTKCTVMYKNCKAFYTRYTALYTKCTPLYTMCSSLSKQCKALCTKIKVLYTESAIKAYNGYNPCHKVRWINPAANIIFSVITLETAGILTVNLDVGR